MAHRDWSQGLRPVPGRRRRKPGVPRPRRRLLRRPGPEAPVFGRARRSLSPVNRPPLRKLAQGVVGLDPVPREAVAAVTRRALWATEWEWPSAISPAPAHCFTLTLLVVRLPLLPSRGGPIFAQLRPRSMPRMPLLGRSWMKVGRSCPPPPREATSRSAVFSLKPQQGLALPTYANYCL